MEGFVTLDKKMKRQKETWRLSGSLSPLLFLSETTISVFTNPDPGNPCAP